MYIIYIIVKYKNCKLFAFKCYQYHKKLQLIFLKQLSDNSIIINNIFIEFVNVYIKYIHKYSNIILIKLTILKC